MFQRDQIERMLRVNGVSPTDPDDVIKSVLISAQWHEDDVEAAVLVLRENKDSHETHVDSLHKVFRSDEHLRPETISSLLGIQMDVTSEDIQKYKEHSRNTMSTSVVLHMAMAALFLSVVFVFAAMWYLKMGLFHQTLL